jgi:signal transduction histidine kinase
MPKGRFFLVAAAFIALAPAVFGQRYPDWRVYHATDGMAESACVSVSIGVNGNILAKHLNVDSISELDGYSITNFESPEVGRSRVYESSGGQLWMSSAAGLEEFRDSVWQFHPIPEFATQFHGMVTAAIPPVPLHVIRQGRVLILLPAELMEFSVEKPGAPRTTVLRTASQTGLQSFLGMTVAADGSLWIAGQLGIAHVPGPLRDLKPDSHWQEFLAPRNLQIENFQQPIADLEGDGITCVADLSSGDEKFAVHFDLQNWMVQPVSAEKLRGAWRGREGLTWVATINSLLQINNSGTPGAEIDEVSSRRYFDVVTETNGAFWIAAADGLFRYSPPLWKSPLAILRLNSPVPCVTEDSESRLWFVSAGALHSLSEGKDREFFTSTGHRILQSVRALLPLKSGDLLLDTGEQLYQLQPGTGALNPVPASRDQRRHVLGLFEDGTVAIQTTVSTGESCEIEKYDGIAFKSFPAAPPDCSASAFLESQNGDIWLGTDHGPMCFHDKKWQMRAKNFTGTIVSLLETAEGKVWCATLDSIWEFNGESWTIVRTGFDQINSSVRTHDGNIWVASNSGLYRYVQGAWIENSVEEGLPSATVREVFQDRSGRVWTGTARGLALFHPEADPDPPRSQIRKQPDSDPLPQSALVTLVFAGNDKWKYTPRDRLLYSYRLDQHDWSQFLDANAVSYSELSPGTHSFEVRAMDRNGNVETTPARLVFAIALPWYEETRLVVISIFCLAVAGCFAALAFNRHRKLVRSYAEVERKIAERTRELEITSRELVHSQKMNALGTLAAGIAHDFNNILSIIKGSAQIIEDNVDNTDKIRTRVDRIKTVVEQGAGIVKAMLGFSAASGDEPAMCDINVVVRDTIQLFGDRFQRDAALIFNPEPDLPQVSAVKEFIQQILLNFVFNAAEAEAGAKRKQIILATRRVRRAPENLVLAPAPAPEYVTVSVQDFGCGISPENISRVFEPFFTTKALSARRGTGLGLSMVYELTKKLNAGLCVESIVGVGSTFTLILPSDGPMAQGNK